jgi:hypothetical protein
MTPGRTSKTLIPNSARRTAQSWVAIPIPAFEMVYSPRLVEASVAEMEEMFTIVPENDSSSCRCSIIQFATDWVRKNGPFRLMSMTRS